VLRSVEVDGLDHNKLCGVDRCKLCKQLFDKILKAICLFVVCCSTASCEGYLIDSRELLLLKLDFFLEKLPGIVGNELGEWRDQRSTLSKQEIT